MKILHLKIALAIILLSCQACTKMDDVQNSTNRVVPMLTDSKESCYLFTITIGHLASECGNACITIGGKPCHLDCMTHGHVCNKSVAVTLESNDGAIYATTIDTFDLTNLDFFVMPARSLNYTDENNNRIFLNIPGQTMYRDTATKQFTFTGLFFSNTAAYGNY